MGADSGVAQDHDVADQACARPDRHVRSDVAEWADANVVGDLRAAFNSGGGMYLGGHLHIASSGCRLHGVVTGRLVAAGFYVVVTTRHPRA